MVMGRSVLTKSIWSRLKTPTITPSPKTSDTTASSTERVGIHEFISEHAKYFLLRFGTSNGQYRLYPALNDSVTNTPSASTGQVVTMDMIAAESYEIDYATLAQREDSLMQVIYRKQDRNMPGINESVTVKPSGLYGQQ